MLNFCNFAPRILPSDGKKVPLAGFEKFEMKAYVCFRSVSADSGILHHYTVVGRNQDGVSNVYLPCSHDEECEVYRLQLN